MPTQLTGATDGAKLRGQTFWGISLIGLKTFSRHGFFDMLCMFFGGITSPLIHPAQRTEQGNQHQSDDGEKEEPALHSGNL
jgi:hypothetical protein